MRKLPNESDSVRQENVLVSREVKPAGGWIESGEQLVFGQRRGAGQGVEQGRFSCVGVADDGSQRPLVTQPPFALGTSLASDGLELDPNPVNSLLNFSAIGFELRFAFATAHADAALLPRKMPPETGE